MEITLVTSTQALYSSTRIHLVADHLFPLITGQPPINEHQKKCHLFIKKINHFLHIGDAKEIASTDMNVHH